MKPGWIRVDTHVLSKETTKEIRGVKVKVSVSPYDIPQLVRGYRDQESNFFVVEFKYMAEEPLKSIQKNPHIEMEVGANSGRIHKIKVDVVGLDCRAVELEVDKDLSGSICQLGAHPRLQERYKLTKDIIASYRQTLFPAAREPEAICYWEP